MARNVTELPPRPRRTAQVQVPTGGGARFRAVFGRALRRRCPYCGGAGIFSGYLSLRDRCPTCGVAFEREEGYFLGAYAINLIVAEILGVGAVIALLLWSDLSTVAMQIIAVVFVIGLPLFFFPYSRSLWMAIDLMVHRPSEGPER